MVRHLALLFLLSLIWGSSFMAIKIGIETIPPLSLAAARVILAAVVLWVFARLQGHGLPKGWRIWIYCFFLGVIGNGLPFTLINWGEQRIDSGLAAILMAVMPLATVVMAHFFTTGDRMTPFKLAGVVIGFGGVVVLVGPEAIKGLGSDIWRQLAVSGGAVSYAIAAILARNMPAAPLIARSAAVMIVASVVMAPLAIIFEAPGTLMPSQEAVWAAVYLGLFPTALATIILFHLLQNRNASFVVPINYLIPVFGVIWGVVALGEAISPRAVTALVVILVGMGIAQYKSRSPSKGS